MQNAITPLHVSSKWGRTKMVTLLLDNKAKIDCSTRVSPAVWWLIYVLVFSKLPWRFVVVLSSETKHTLFL